jgi:hypothetical protein
LLWEDSKSDSLLVLEGEVWKQGAVEIVVSMRKARGLIEGLRHIPPELVEWV